MKKMKLFVAMVILAVGVFVIYSCTKEDGKLKSSEGNINLETRGFEEDLLDALGTECFDEQTEIPGCNNAVIMQSLTVTTMPSYPGCTFEILFGYYECPLISGINLISVTDYQIVSHNCAAFSVDLVNPANTVVWGSFLHDFDAEMYSQIERYLLAQSFANGNYPCGSGLYTQITFYTSSCYQSCITRFDRNGTNYNGIIKQGCGVQCCNFTTEHCENNLSDPILLNSYTNPVNGPTCQDKDLLKYVNCLNQQQIAERPCVFRCE